MASERPRQRRDTGPSPEQIARLAFLDVRRRHWRDPQRAEDMGVNRRTLSRWRRRPEYQAARLAAEAAAQDANPLEAVLLGVSDAEFDRIVRDPSLLPDELFG